MCKIYDNSATGVIKIIGGGVTFESRYGKDVGRKVYNKIRNKVNSCHERDIDFVITWEMLDLLVDKWVMGSGTCDYTGQPFTLSLTSPFRPTLERVDSSLGYEEGNLCIVTYEANCLKSKFENINEETLNIKIPSDKKEKFAKMWSVLSSPKKINSTVKHYIPKQKEETKMTATVKVEKEIVITTTQHEDIELSGLYSNFMKFFLSMGKDVELSFSQFKHIYKRKSCFLSGEKFVGDNKHPLLLGDKVTASTLTFAIEKYATPFQNLIDQSGMTPTLLLNNLNKNLK